MIDVMMDGKECFVYELIYILKDVLEKQIMKVLDVSGINEELKVMQEEERKMKE